MYLSHIKHNQWIRVDSIPANAWDTIWQHIDKGWFGSQKGMRKIDLIDDLGVSMFRLRPSTSDERINNIHKWIN